MRLFRLLRAGKYAEIARMKSRQSADKLRKRCNKLTNKEKQKNSRIAKLRLKIADITGPREPVKGERQFKKIEREVEATKWAITELRKLQFLGKFPLNCTNDLRHMAVSVDFGRAYRHRENYTRGVYGPELMETVVPIIAFRTLESNVDRDYEFMNSWAHDRKKKINSKTKTR